MFRRQRHDVRDTELERRLGAERPQAPDELVRRLSAQVEPEPQPRPSTMPRAAFVCGVTAALVLSLGVAGAIGSATGSIHGFSRRVFHLVRPPAPSTGPARIREVGSGPPFAQQHAALIPSCWKGQIKWMTPFEYLRSFAAGASPARDCVIRR